MSLTRESLVSDIPAGDGKIANLFLQCTVCSHPEEKFDQGVRLQLGLVIDRLLDCLVVAGFADLAYWTLN